MRIANQSDLTADLHRYFGAPRGKNKAFIEWLEKAWVRAFLKKPDNTFITPVVVDKLPAFFKVATPLPPRLVIDPDGQCLEYEPQSEWDLKDAEAGSLRYYQPKDRTLYCFFEEVTEVRDYVLELLEQHPTTNMAKRSWTDVVTASRKWHEEQARMLAARLAAEEEQRRRDLKVSSGTMDFHNLDKGVDWMTAHPGPLVCSSKSLMLIRLTSPRSLLYESFKMDHCVHSYYERIYDEQTVILSVRDFHQPSEPLITVEISTPIEGESYDPFIVQIKGAHNHDPNLTVYGFPSLMQQLLPSLKKEVLAPLTKPSKSTDLSFRVVINRD